MPAAVISFSSWFGLVENFFASALYSTCVVVVPPASVVVVVPDVVDPLVVDVDAVVDDFFIWPGADAFADLVVVVVALPFGVVAFAAFIVAP
jgi:hypothetical protein